MSDKTDSLIERALLRPDKRSTKEVLIIILLILIFLGILFIGYKLSFLQNSLTALGSVQGVNL